MTEEQAQPETEAPAEAEAPAPAPPPSPAVSQTLKLLMNREAAARAAVEEQKQTAGYEQKYKQLESLLEKSPLEALKLKGHSYESLSERVLAQDPVAEKTVALTRKVTELEKSIALKQQQEEEFYRQQAHEQERLRLKEYIDTSENDSIVRRLGLHDSVYNHIQTQLRENPDVEIGDDEAVKVIEQQILALLDLAMKDDEIRQRYEKPAPSLTLSNQQASQTPTRTDPETMTRDQRLQLLIDSLQSKEHI